VIWLDQIIQGTLLGGYYALIACGLSLMFGVMRIINLAHGDFAILGVFAVWLLVAQTGISPFLALAAVVPVMALFGWALQHWVFERSLRAGPLVPLLATFGLAIVIENLLFEGFGADTRSLAPEIGDLAFDSWTLTDRIYVGHLAVLIFAVAVILLVGLQLFLKRTVLGRAIRATAEDPEAAELVGVNSRAVYAVAAAIAVATTAIAGTFLAMRAAFDPYSGPAQLIFAFEAVVIGGVGSLWGTLIGGIVLGIAQSLGAQVGPRGFLLTGHIVFLVVLGARLFLSRVDLRAAMRRGVDGVERSPSS
jgi:branched-chain amino acid transport system permease protein